MQLFMNNWQAELLEPLAAGGTVLSIDPALAEELGELTGDDHYILTLSSAEDGIENRWEIIRADAVAGGDLTIQRAVEYPSQDVDWPAGTMISARITAETLNAMASRIVSLEQQVVSLDARVTALEPPPPVELVVTIGIGGGAYSAGYLGIVGAIAPDSVDVPGHGSFTVHTAAFYADTPPRFSLIFDGAFPPELVSAVNVEGAGYLPIAEATTAANEVDGPNSFTVYEWSVESSDWFASSGQQRTIGITFTPA